MIEVSGLRKKFGEIDALSDVSFSVEKGQIVGFLGANGAGKTTTMDILCGCIGPSYGYVRIAGYDVTDHPQQVKKRIGYLPDEPPIHDDMRVEEFVTYAARLRKIPKQQIADRVASTLEKLDLVDMKHRLVGNLSKGYRQRVGLAQALVHNPEVLILDEPTEGLDPNQIIQIRELIKSLKGDHTILFSSHILSEVESICDNLIIIHKGQVVEQGTYQEILKKSETMGQYVVKVLSDVKGLFQSLEQISSIKGLNLISEESGEISFHADQSQNTIDIVAKQILDGSHGLIQISPKSKSLEDIFFQLTH